MKVLIVNDDGIDAVGINVLAEVFSAKHEVLVVAPREQRSGYSHAMTFEADIEYERAERPYPAYAISGSPADCTKMGLLCFNEGAPVDLVLSGINAGPNLGIDVLYSGTVAAATEGATAGIPSIAVSMCKKKAPEEKYREAARFILDNAEKLISLWQVGKGVINVNYPVLIPVKGEKITRTAMIPYHDKYERGTALNSYKAVWGALPDDADIADSDVGYAARGFVTVTPLTTDRSDYEAIAKAQGKNFFD